MIGEDIANTLSTMKDQAICYRTSSFGNYEEGFGTLKASGGDLGGSETLIVYGTEQTDY